ncbi:hypothetical protein BGZ63DRAFT_78614 [Mariannaea sp. PMI_226]|nr:hypothetical protein BGZ63DRAFT_78614 [Mariannaea sp. PMI_226]
MNPERIAMLERAAEEEAARPLLGSMKQENTSPPPASGANCAPVGDASLRAQRRAFDVPQVDTMAPHPSEDANFGPKPLQQNTGDSRPRSLIKVVRVVPSGLADEPLVEVSTKGFKSSLKRPYAEFDREGDVPSSRPQNNSRQTLDLGPAPTPNNDTRILTTLLHHQDLVLSVQSHESLEHVSTKVYKLQISRAGLRHHEMLEHFKSLHVLPLSIRDPDTSIIDGVIHRTVEGELLEDLWYRSPKKVKHEYAKQLRTIVDSMRQITTSNQGSAQAGKFTLLLDKHTRHTYYAIRPAGTGRPSQLFLAFLLSSMYGTVPKRVAQALVRQIKTKGRQVLSHSAICPRNIVVRHGKIEWVIGWDCAG